MRRRATNGQKCVDAGLAGCRLDPVEPHIAEYEVVNCVTAPGVIELRRGRRLRALRDKLRNSACLGDVVGEIRGDVAGIVSNAPNQRVHVCHVDGFMMCDAIPRFAEFIQPGMDLRAV